MKNNELERGRLNYEKDCNYLLAGTVYSFHSFPASFVEEEPIALRIGRELMIDQIIPAGGWM